MKRLFFILLIVLFYNGTSLAQLTSYGGLQAAGTTAGVSGNNTNSYFGHQAGVANIGNNNSFVGYQSGFANTIGANNTSYGAQALRNNTTAQRNLAFGANALYTQSYVNGGVVWNSDNVAVGFEALYTNNPTSTFNGNQNTAMGTQALRSNTNGFANTAYGFQALYSNTTAWCNTAVGNAALISTTTGIDNTGIGVSALVYNTTGYTNTAIGRDALYFNTTGYHNTGCGRSALYSNSTGFYNTALGKNADVSVGTLTNATVIGHTGVVNASNKVRLGNASVTVVEGQVAYSFPSDGRFKTNISENDVKGLDFIKKLRPVVYNFDTRKFTEFLTKNMPETLRKEHLDKDFAPSTAIRQSGFIAQEIEQAAQAVGYDFNGLHKPDSEYDYYSLAYSQFVIPLVKAVQELSAMVETQKQENQTLRQELETLKNAVYGATVKTAGGKTTAQSEPQTLPDGFALYQNVPNPFYTSTVIAAQLPESVQQAKIIVYNLQGLELASYPLPERGKVSVEISGGRFPSGMYLYALVADGQVIDTKKMILTN